MNILWFIFHWALKNRKYEHLVHNLALKMEENGYILSNMKIISALYLNIRRCERV